MNDVESGDIDAVEDTNSTTMDTSFRQNQNLLYPIRLTN